MPECQVIRPDHREIEIQSGAMTRLAGVSEALTGSSAQGTDDSTPSGSYRVCPSIW